MRERHSSDLAQRNLCSRRSCDLSEGRVCAHTLGLRNEAARAVDGSADDLCIFCLLDGDGFTKRNKSKWGTRFRGPLSWVRASSSLCGCGPPAKRDKSRSLRDDNRIRLFVIPKGSTFVPPIASRGNREQRVETRSHTAIRGIIYRVPGLPPFPAISPSSELTLDRIG